MQQDPDVREGTFIRLVGASVPDERKGYYLVTAVEPFTYETGDTDTAEFVSVNSGAESGYRNIPVLEPDNIPMHLQWNKWGFKDGCRYQVKIPNGSDRLGLDDDKDVARLDNRKSPWCEPNPDYGFWLINEMYPAINAINNTGAALTPKVYFEGKRFSIEKVTATDVMLKLQNGERGITPFIPVKKITLGGLPST